MKGGQVNAKEQAWREHMKTYDRDRSHNPDFSSTRHRKHCFEAGWDAAVAEAREPLVEALRAVEWHRTSAKWGTITTDVCPSCGETEIDGHNHDCPLAAALAAKGAEP